MKLPVFDELVTKHPITTVNDYATDFKNIKCGIVFLYCGWSPTIYYLSFLVDLLKPFHTIPLLILDIDHPQTFDYLYRQGIISHGWGETYWISEGDIIAESSYRTPDEKKVMANNDLLITNSIATFIREVSDMLTDLSWYEFSVKSYNGYTLVIEGGLSSTYPELEITFYQVSYCQLKSYWNKGAHLPFTILSGEEAARLNQLHHIEIGHVLIRIAHEEMLPDQSNAYLIAAQKIEYTKLHKYEPEV